MEKKLTKKELKEIEERQEEKRIERRKVIEALKNLEEDVRATTRYYKLHNMADKLDYYDGLKAEEKAELLRNYECLNFLKPHAEYTKEEKDQMKDRAWNFVRMMVWTEQEYQSLDEGRKLEQYIEKDAIWNDDIIWNIDHLKVYIDLALKYGYTKIYYTNTSTGALSNITDFIDLGAKVVGTCSKKGYEKAGIIFDITGIIEEEAE